MRKLGRNYILRVESSEVGTVEVKPPFTLEFDIVKNVLSSANTATFSIYNLAENTRNQIRKDELDYGLLKQITFDAGYGENFSEVMSGNVIQAYSSKQGNNIVTSLQCFDGGFAFANSKINKSYPSGALQRSVVLDMVKSLEDYNIKTGAIGNIPGTLGRGNSYSGNTVEILKEITGGGFYIDNEKANVLSDDEVVESDIDLIDASFGLLGTPRREQTFLMLDLLFEPRFKIGQSIILDSVTEKIFNGAYKIVSLKHSGTISEAVSGSATTTVGLSFWGKNLKTIQSEFF